jgi:hypothetical protein
VNLPQLPQITEPRVIGAEPGRIIPLPASGAVANGMKKGALVALLFGPAHPFALVALREVI